MQRQALYTPDCLSFLDMKTRTVAERIQYMMDTLEITEQTAFGDLAEATRSVVNQWLTGNIKSIAAKYAFSLEDQTGFSAKWIMLGEGPERKRSLMTDEPPMDKGALFANVYANTSGQGREAMDWVMKFAESEMNRLRGPGSRSSDK